MGKMNWDRIEQERKQRRKGKEEKEVQSFTLPESSLSKEDKERMDALFKRFQKEQGDIL